MKIETTTPLGHTTTYTRNDRRMLAMAYTSIGRLQNLTDPVGNEWQYAYNERGILNRTTYQTGETQNRTYDETNNIVRRLYSDGTDLQFTYDNLNRSVGAGAGITFLPDSQHGWTIKANED
jgi:YD repeat-containing protein